MRRTPKENLNQGFINLIRKAHGLIENTDIEKHRHSQDQMGALFGNNREVEVTETSVGSMYAEWIRVDRPHSGRKIILYCHGGGYSTGSPLYARTLTTKLASLLSMDVFCFDYRLAPEHPYPAAVDDAQAAWDYLMLQGYGAKDIFVAGDSAGGNLALALGLRLKGQKRMLPAGFVLMSPWTDLTVSGRTHETKADVDPVLNQNYLNEMIGNYVPQAKKNKGEAAEALQDAEDLAEEKHEVTTEISGTTVEKVIGKVIGKATEKITEKATDKSENEPVNKTFEELFNIEYLQNPEISPLFGDFTGFPPTYIQVGDLEVLMSDSTMLQKKMSKDGVSVSLDTYKNMWHVFQMAPFKTAVEAIQKCGEFIYSVQ